MPTPSQFASGADARAAQPWNEHRPSPETGATGGPELPRGTRPFEPPSFVVLGFGFLVAAVAAGAVSAPFGLGGWVIGGITGATLAVIGVVMIVGEYAWMPRIRRDLLALQRGGYLVKWEYTDREWRGFLRAEWERTRGWALAGLVALIAGAALVALWPAGSVVTKKVFLLLAIVAGLIALAGGVMFGAGVLLQRRGRRAIGTAYVGPGIVYFNRGYIMWNRLGWRLASVRIIPGDAAVVEFEVCYGGDNGNTMRIPIPHGCMDEARDLVRKLKGS